MVVGEVGPSQWSRNGWRRAWWAVALEATSEQAEAILYLEEEEQTEKDGEKVTIAHKSNVTDKEGNEIVKAARKV